MGAPSWVYRRQIEREQAVHSSDVTRLNSRINELQQENATLRERVKELEDENAKLRAKA
ncbi:MAG: hypothetical protein NWF05_10140 [Candidatus Bathyarchaeota archaeon]|nr:hypothetical protein [Candidatus Bathyarchaeota archaeon]